MEDAALFFGVLGAFVAFLDEHKRCGDLEGGRDDGIVWLSCPCGGHIAHPAAARAAGSACARLTGQGMRIEQAGQALAG